MLTKFLSLLTFEARGLKINLCATFGTEKVGNSTDLWYAHCAMTLNFLRGWLYVVFRYSKVFRLVCILWMYVDWVNEWINEWAKKRTNDWMTELQTMSIESKWTLGNKCSAKGSPFQCEEPTTKGSSPKRGFGEMRIPAEKGNFRKQVLFCYSNMFLPQNIILVGTSRPK